MFYIKDKIVTIKSVTPRIEFHGEEKVNVIYISCKSDLPNTALNEFDKRLVESFYQSNPQSEIPMSENINFPDIKFPDLKKVFYDYEGEGYRMIINRGVTGDQDIILIQASITNFKMFFQQGGSVELWFSIKARANEKDSGQLCTVLGTDVHMTLEPPKASAMATLKSV